MPNAIKTEIVEEVFGELEPKSSRLKWWIIGIIVIILVLAGIYYFYIVPSGLFPQLHPIYQAVFLTNGQVYFGKLYHQNSQYPTLRDIYYLQVTQPPQPLQPSQATPPANINVVKLGGELHGPADEMRINKAQILFIEDLRTDSRVIQAIQQFKATQTQ